MSPEPVVFTLAVPEPAGGPVKDVWADLDMPAITAALGSTGVWAPADQAVDLKKLVAEAKADGHQLSVVAIENLYSPFTVYRDIAATLQSEVGGTVLVFGPGGVGTASSEFSRVELEDATQEIGKGASASQAAASIYHKAVEPNVDWTLVTIGLVLAVIVGAVVARVFAGRRARMTAPEGAETPRGDAASDVVRTEDEASADADSEAGSR